MDKTRQLWRLFFFPKTTDQDGEGTLAEIESSTAILEKGSPTRDILMKKFKQGFLLKSAPDARSDVHLPKVAEE